jgi:hypothetical protein
MERLVFDNDLQKMNIVIEFDKLSNDTEWCATGRNPTFSTHRTIKFGNNHVDDQYDNGYAKSDRSIHDPIIASPSPKDLGGSDGSIHDPVIASPSPKDLGGSVDNKFCRRFNHFRSKGKEYNVVKHSVIKTIHDCYTWLLDMYDRHYNTFVKDDLYGEMIIHPNFDISTASKWTFTLSPDAMSDAVPMIAPDGASDL